MSDDREAQICDHEAARLLPWLVIGALPEGDRARVQAHLKDCRVCAADFEHEQRVRAHVSREPTVEHAPQPGLQRLMTRINELEREMPEGAVGARAPSRRRRVVQWLAAAVVVQTIGLGILGTLIWKRGVEIHEPRFHTLSSSASTAKRGDLRVVFASSTTAGELNSLLSSLPASIIDGPSPSGVYTLSLKGDQASVQSALERLRKRPGVLFAEPGMNVNTQP